MRLVIDLDMEGPEFREDGGALASRVLHDLADYLSFERGGLVQGMSGRLTAWSRDCGSWDVRP